MAQLFPSIETIEKLRPRPTLGELECLRTLRQKLSNDYEIYFQPYINGDHPDIIVLRKNAGVFILEVKEWDLNNYEIDEQDNWVLKKNNIPLKSPLKQVITYKNNLYNLHIPGLLEKNTNDKKVYALIQTGVYFHNAKDSEINNFIVKKDKYFKLFGFDSLKEKVVSDTFIKNYKYSFFTEELYLEFRRFLQPPFHTIEQGEDIKYSEKQEELSTSSANKQQKIKGFAGSGKTLILAKRAVNSHKRTQKKVLILSFNITLKNYIHDQISKVKENFKWGNFYIDNYHNFINSQTNNLNIKIQETKRIKHLSDYEDLELFEDQKNSIVKYDSIFIDEIQDYKTEWINIIKKYFLAENGEFVVFGDEKQNIYDRKLDSEKKPNTTIQGRWAELNEPCRFSDNMARMASRFQEEYLRKYTLDDIQMGEQGRLSYDEENIYYLNFDDKTPVRKLIDTIWIIIKEKNIHPNDICILSSKMGMLRSFDYEIRIRKKEKTKTTFETKEVFEKLGKNGLAIDEVRKNKKFNFRMNSGTPKLSTIHSFKGWEIPTLFLVIAKEDKDELIYTAITRCRVNLFIININNEKYANFFKKNNDIVNILSSEIIEQEDEQEIIKEEAIKESHISFSEGNNDIVNTLSSEVIEREDEQEAIKEAAIKESHISFSEGSNDITNTLSSEVVEQEDEQEAIEAAIKESHISFSEGSNDITNTLSSEVVEQEDKQATILGKEETIREIEQKERSGSIPHILNELKGHNNKFKLCILGEISGDKKDFESQIGAFFRKSKVGNTEWDIKFIDNKKLKNTNILKSFRCQQSGYSLLVTGQIYQHSSKNNVAGNLLQELQKPNKYIDSIAGSHPKKKLTIDNLLDELDKYLDSKGREMGLESFGY